MSVHIKTTSFSIELFGDLFNLMKKLIQISTEGKECELEDNSLFLFCIKFNTYFDNRAAVNHH